MAWLDIDGRSPRLLLCAGLCLLWSVSPVYTVRLLSIPQNVNSHYIDHGRVACALAGDGHDVTMFVASSARLPEFLQKCNVEIVQYVVTGDVPFLNTEEATRLILDASLAGSWIEQFQAMKKIGESLMQHWHQDCIMMLESDVIKEHMRARRYDAVLADNTGLDCQAVLPILHDIPVILFGVMSMQYVYRAPALPSFVPNIMSQLSDRMTFLERLQNTLTTVMISWVVLNNVTIYQKYAPASGVSDILQVYRDSIFYLVLDDPAVSYPLPMMPNMAYIGDMIPQPARTLPHHIKLFVEGAPDGVIVVSFGSFVDYLPGEIVAKFCRSFIKLKQRVVWKLKDKDMCEASPDKIMLLDWLPQNDLLGHPNTKLFVSHAGMNSILESIYHGTPILAVPITFDQPYNAARIQHKQHGLQMSIKDFTEDEILIKVNDIINSDVISQKVEVASDVMKNNIVSPARRASYWVEHVIKYGDKHLRTGAFELNELQFFMVDVFLTVAIACIVLIVILLCMVRLCFICFRRTCYCCKRPRKIKTG